MNSSVPLTNYRSKVFSISIIIIKNSFITTFFPFLKIMLSGPIFILELIITCLMVKQIGFGFYIFNFQWWSTKTTNTYESHERLIIDPLSGDCRWTRWFRDTAKDLLLLVATLYLW